MTDIQNKPLSDADRAKAYRERKKRNTVQLTRVPVELLDELVEFYQLDGHQQLINDLIELPLIRAIEAMQGWKINPDTSQIDETVLANDSREVLSTAKRIIWRGMCMGEMPPLLDEALEQINKPIYPKE